MATTTISTHIHHGVVLDKGNYGATLTITDSGKISTTAYGVYADSSGVSLVNDGRITAKTVAVELMAGGTVRNSGIIDGAADGVVLNAGGLLINTGKIFAKTVDGVDLGSGASLENTGNINSGNIGVYLGTLASLSNGGTIHGDVAGVRLAGGTATNSGTISATGTGGTGVDLTAGTLVNTGMIRAKDGVFLAGGQLTDSGTIWGTSIAIDASGTFGLTIDPGAVFKGDVKDSSGTGTIKLAGTVAGTLAGIGSSITGFSQISLASGSWTVEGDLAGLANGQAIRNFNAQYQSPNNTIVITDFAATNGYSVPGTGLTLTNGATAHVVNLQNFYGHTVDYVAVYTEHGSTYLVSDFTGAPKFHETPGTISQIDGFTSLSVSPGEGSNAVGVTIGAAGTISTKYGPAVYAPKGAGSNTVVNYGLLEAANRRTVVDYPGKVTNSGTIVGSAYAGTMFNSGIIMGGADAFSLTNSGTILGAAYGATVNDTGLIDDQTGAIGIGAGDPGGVSIGSTGTVIGHTEGVYYIGGGTHGIQNFGHIFGGVVGVTITTSQSDTPFVQNYGSVGGGDYGFIVKHGATILNAGTITGGNYAIIADDDLSENLQALNLIVKPGAVFNGSVVDSSGLGQLTLAGTSAGSLDMGISFGGFDGISFIGGSTWQLEGAKDDLATGETINGFGISDTIVLDGFSTTSDIYMTGKGLLLTSGSVTVTLDITGSFTTGSFQVSNVGGNTKIIENSASAAVAGLRHAATGGSG